MKIVKITLKKTQITIDFQFYFDSLLSTIPLLLEARDVTWDPSPSTSGYWARTVSPGHAFSWLTSGRISRRVTVHVTAFVPGDEQVFRRCTVSSCSTISLPLDQLSGANEVRDGCWRFVRLFVPVSFRECFHQLVRFDPPDENIGSFFSEEKLQLSCCFVVFSDYVR